MEKKCKDSFDNDVTAGDTVVYVSSYGSWLTKGVVAEVISSEFIKIKGTNKIIYKTKFAKWN